VPHFAHRRLITFLVLLCQVVTAGVVHVAVAYAEAPARLLLVLSVGAIVACGSTPPADRVASDASGKTLDVVELSATDARDRIAAGTLTSRALTQAYLDRIAAVDDKGPSLNAVIR